jgi:predicted acylesterase/phospholipase RssA
MEEHNKESKRIKKEKIETLNNNKKLNLEGVNKFGIIKEEDNESSSNSFESLSHYRKKIKKEKFKIESRNNEIDKKNKSFKIKNNLNIANISKQNKKINDNILNELKEAIKEFEFDQNIICKTEVNNINNKNENMIKQYKTNHIKHKKNRRYLSDILTRKERNGIKIILVSKENERIKNTKKNKRRIIEENNKEKENIK